MVQRYGKDRLGVENFGSDSLNIEDDDGNVTFEYVIDESVDKKRLIDDCYNKNIMRTSCSTINCVLHGSFSITLYSPVNEWYEMHGSFKDGRLDDVIIVSVYKININQKTLRSNKYYFMDNDKYFLKCEERGTTSTYYDEEEHVTCEVVDGVFKNAAELHKRFTRGLQIQQVNMLTMQD